MSAKLFVVSAALLSLLTSPALAEPMVCPRTPGSIPGPFVPDAETAKAVFQAIERNMSGTYNGRPLVVHDEGAVWVVWRDPPPSPAGSRTFGGGMLTLEIDKCTGAVVKAYYAR